MPDEAKRPADYDDDFVAWSEDQAARIRALPPEIGRLIDIENVAEEIETLGRSEVATVASHLRNILTHLILMASTPNAPPAGHWRAECIVFQDEAIEHFTPSMRRKLRMAKLWSGAVKIAQAKLEAYGDTMIALPASCPFTLDQLLDRQVEMRNLAAKLAA